VPSAICEAKKFGDVKRGKFVEPSLCFWQSHLDAQSIKRFIRLVEWTREDQPDTRDVLSLVRTWENIWSFLTKNALAKTIRDEGQKIIARKIITAVLTAIGYGFVTILGRVPGAEWVEPTFEFLKSNIQHFLPK
jgi:hypothetical protein